MDATIPHPAGGARGQQNRPVGGVILSEGRSPQSNPQGFAPALPEHRTRRAMRSIGI